MLVGCESVLHILILEVLQFRLNLFLPFLRLTNLVQFVALEVLEYLELLLLLHGYRCVRRDAPSSRRGSSSVGSHSAVLERKYLLLKLLNVQWLELTWYYLVTEEEIRLILLVVVVDAFYLQLLLKLKKGFLGRWNLRRTN